MTQEKINKEFEKRKANYLYSTSDDEVFERYSKATQHAQTLPDKKIDHWVNELKNGTAR